MASKTEATKTAEASPFYCKSQNCKSKDQLLFKDFWVHKNNYSGTLYCQLQTHTHTHTHTDTYRPTDYFNPLMAAFPVAAPGNSVNATTTNASWGGNVFPLCEARINQSSMNINSQSPLKAKPSIPIAQALCHALRLGVRCTRRNMCCYRKQICYI